MIQQALAIFATGKTQIRSGTITSIMATPQWRVRQAQAGYPHVAM